MACCEAPPGYGTTLFLSQSASHRTSLDQMQSITALASVLIVRYPIELHRETSLIAYKVTCTTSGNYVQLRLAIQKVWNSSQKVWEDFPQARIILLRTFIPLRCTLVHEVHGLSQALLTLLHLTVYCSEQNATRNFCLVNDDSQTISLGSFRDY